MKLFFELLWTFEPLEKENLRSRSFYKKKLSKKFVDTLQTSVGTGKWKVGNCKWKQSRNRPIEIIKQKMSM